MSRDRQLLKDVGEQFAKGNMEFVGPYLADGVKWNILGMVPSPAEIRFSR